MSAAVVQAALHPGEKLAELGASAAVGAGLGALSHMGMGRYAAAGIGAAMTIKMGYDELTGNRWTKFAGAVKDTWHGAGPNNAQMQRNIEITRDSLGSFLVDTGIGFAAGGLTRAGLPFAERKSLVHSQHKLEDPELFKRQAFGKLEVVAHTEPERKGMPSGDLIKVATTPDDKLLFFSMDVEGHGINAAKKSLQVHGIIDQVLPESAAKSPSDLLGMIDKRLNSRDELSVTAAVAKYDPQTHTLETAKASSHSAYKIDGAGKAHLLGDAEGGLALGSDIYSLAPAGTQTVHLGEHEVVVLASDGVFDRFGYGNKTKGFQQFLEQTGPNPAAIKEGILKMGQPENGADDASFLIFSRPQ